MSDYDSAADTLAHTRRVAQLLAPIVGEIAERAAVHDASKLEDPEKAVFDRVTSLLATTTYGTDEYRAQLASMGNALQHHYRENRHHPEHYQRGIGAMTLGDLLEMLADWKAATERHADGSLNGSIRQNLYRFNIGDQLAEILWATARAYDWLDRDECGLPWTAPDGTRMMCNMPHGHAGLHADGNYDGGQIAWNDAGQLDGGWVPAAAIVDAAYRKSTEYAAVDAVDEQHGPGEICECGHSSHHHDVAEADGSDRRCCVDGCECETT